MALTVKSGAYVLAAARARFLGADSPDGWLIAVRWLAVSGMLITALAGRSMVPGLRLFPLLATMTAVAAVNAGWTALLRAGVLLGSGSTVGAQIVLDLVALGAMLWFSGGLANPFAPFLTFQIVLAGILGTRRTTVVVTLLAVGTALVLCMAPTLPLESAGGDRARVEGIARAVAVVALGGFTGVFVFVAAHRMALLRESSSRSEKLAGLGRTVAAICHELNTPLGTILVAGKDLVHIGRELGSTDVQELARTVTDDAQRAAEIIGVMRGYVSPSERRETLAIASFVERYANQQLDHLGFRGERQILTHDADAGLSLVVLRSALSQILTNVLANSVEAMAGTIEPRLVVRVTERDTEVEVSIRDNGPGVSAELIQRLGEPFQTTKQNSGGTGLGLYVSGLLAERMGAVLQLESAPGKGTCVTLALQKGTLSSTMQSATAQFAGARVTGPLGVALGVTSEGAPEGVTATEGPHGQD